MDRLDRIEAERACERLIMRYALAVNTWDVDAFVALFAADAIWQRPNVPPLQGHDAIRAFMNQQPARRILRHVNGMYLVTIDAGGDTASAISQTTVYDTPGDHALPAPLTQPDMVVEYHDRLVRIDGEWRFARRDTTQVFAAQRA